MLSPLLMISALTLGLVTSLHCLGMCGPLALALPIQRRGRAAYFASRILYNFGRTVTYAALGGVAGMIGQSFTMGGVQRGLSIAAGLLVLGGLWLYRYGLLEKTGVFRIFARLQNLWSRHCRSRGLSALFILGLINGLLPCGPVYVALAAAIATGTVTQSISFMFVFGLGTIPLMLAVSMAGKLVQMPLRLQMQRLIPASALVVALLLIVRGLALGIPYVSPSAEATVMHQNGGHACCAVEK